MFTKSRPSGNPSPFAHKPGEWLQDYRNTPEQRAAALTVVQRCADEAGLAELMAMLGYGDFE